jgi:hypothetical protein
MTSLGFDLSDGPSPPVPDICQFLTDDSSPFPPRPVHSGTPAFKKSKWTPDEDELLRRFVEIHGLGNWSAIAQNIPGRNGKQCRERWMNQLCPALNKDNWSPQEDAILVQQQRVFGNVWSQIAQFLPGRSPNSVKNRWSWLSRHTVSPALAARMMPYIAPKNLVFGGGQEMTAPPHFEWGGGTIGFSELRGAFSDPGELSGEVRGSGSAEAEEGEGKGGTTDGSSEEILVANLFTDPRTEPERDDEKEELMQRFEDWSF